MTLDLPGFADPVHGAQACFRALLEAMSRPGTVAQTGDGLTPPAPLMPATAAVLLTLADHETPVALGAAFAPAADWIAFHCGAPRTEAAAAAIVLADALPDLDALGAGSDDGPEDGATVILQVARLDGPARFRLTGPGIATHADLSASGLPADFCARWAANHARFPRGIDLILCDGHRLAALPRTTAVEAL